MSNREGRSALHARISNVPFLQIAGGGQDSKATIRATVVVLASYQPCVREAAAQGSWVADTPISECLRASNS